ncbi:MAG: hypothetical protein ACK41F_14715 [Fimbriimonadaceae bacterium]
MTKPNSKNKPPENRALNLLAASVELEAAPAEGDAQKLRHFTMTAYTGGAMQLAGWRYPVVVDLQGLQVGRQRRPILLDHTRDVDFVMGQTDSIAVMNNQLVVAGQVMGDSPKARQVIALNDRGFAWQASIGARADQVEFVPDGKTSQANGREFTGPVNIVRRVLSRFDAFVRQRAKTSIRKRARTSRSCRKFPCFTSMLNDNIWYFLLVRAFPFPENSP